MELVVVSAMSTWWAWWLAASFIMTQRLVLGGCCVRRGKRFFVSLWLEVQIYLCFWRRCMTLLMVLTGGPTVVSRLVKFFIGVWRLQLLACFVFYLNLLLLFPQQQSFPTAPYRIANSARTASAVFRTRSTWGLYANDASAAVSVPWVLWGWFGWRQESFSFVLGFLIVLFS